MASPAAAGVLTIGRLEEGLLYSNEAAKLCLELLFDSVEVLIEGSARLIPGFAALLCNLRVSISRLLRVLVGRQINVDLVPEGEYRVEQLAILVTKKMRRGT